MLPHHCMSRTISKTARRCVLRVRPQTGRQESSSPSLLCTIDHHAYSNPRFMSSLPQTCQLARSRIHARFLGLFAVLQSLSCSRTTTVVLRKYLTTVYFCFFCFLCSSRSCAPPPAVPAIMRVQTKAATLPRWKVPTDASGTTTSMTTSSEAPSRPSRSQAPTATRSRQVPPNFTFSILCQFYLTNFILSILSCQFYRANFILSILSCQFCLVNFVVSILFC